MRWKKKEKVINSISEVGGRPKRGQESTREQHEKGGWGTKEESTKKKPKGGKKTIGSKRSLNSA